MTDFTGDPTPLEDSTEQESMPPPIPKKPMSWVENTRRRFYKLIGLRLADIDDKVRDTCERYGEQVIGTMLAGGFTPSTPDLRTVYRTKESRLHARDWLTERSDIKDWREKWVSRRDLVLEILVILLIWREISLSITADTHQAENFTAQQAILTAMQKSTKDTADQLALLKSTTEQMNQGVERNAKAAEASSATAAKSLVVSERAYVTAASMSTEPKTGEKLKITNSFVNSGKTPAIDFKAKSWQGVMAREIAVEDAYKQAVASVALDDKASSNMILGPAQSSQNVIELAQALTESDITAINNGTLVWYVFVELRYDDTFGRHHITFACSRSTVLCNTLNKAN
jgi:hypothetical protein